MGCSASKDISDAIPAQAKVSDKVDVTAEAKEFVAEKVHSTVAKAGELPADTKIIFVLGGPGSGKGTQCERIVAKYGYKHLSAGDLLREEVASGSTLGKGLEELMREGKLVTKEVTIGLLKAAMIKSGRSEFLIDGFPREIDQAETFESQITACRFILFFDCPESVMEERLLNRGKTSGRTDDNAETIKKRFHTFVNASLPVIEKYEAIGKVHRISAVPPPDEVFEVVSGILDADNEKPAAKAESTPARPSLKSHAVEADPDTPGADLGTSPAESAEADDAAPAAAAAEPGSKRPSEAAKRASEPAGSLPEDVRIVFVLGGPGSGKGTQCERIVAAYGYQHLSAGDLLRDEVKSGSPIGKELEETMKEGKLVAMEVTIGLLKKAMIKSGKKDFLIDGFPRALDQAEKFESEIKPCELVLFFDCPEDVMEERLLNRGKTSGRADDNSETIKKRFHTFVDSSLPVIEKYKAEGKAACISAVPPPDEVFAKVKIALDKLRAEPAAEEASEEAAHEAAEEAAEEAAQEAAQEAEEPALALA